MYKLDFPQAELRTRLEVAEIIGAIADGYNIPEGVGYVFNPALISEPEFVPINSLASPSTKPSYDELESKEEGTTVPFISKMYSQHPKNQLICPNIRQLPLRVYGEIHNLLLHITTAFAFALPIIAQDLPDGWKEIRKFTALDWRHYR